MIKQYLKDDDPNKFWRLSRGQHENLIDEALDRIEYLEIALQIIAGERQALDNLMCNADIAKQALAT